MGKGKLIPGSSQRPWLPLACLTTYSRDPWLVALTCDAWASLPAPCFQAYPYAPTTCTVPNCSFGCSSCLPANCEVSRQVVGPFF